MIDTILSRRESVPGFVKQNQREKETIIDKAAEQSFPLFDSL